MAESQTLFSFTLFDVPAGQRARFAVLASVLSLASASCLVWLIAQGALHFRLSPAALITEAFACACLAGLATAAVSAMLHGEVWKTAVTGVWLGPAVLLLAQNSPVAPVAVLVFVIFATRHVCEGWTKYNAEPCIGYFSTPCTSIFGPQVGEPQSSRDLWTSIAAAAAAQAGAGAMLLRCPTSGMVFSSIGGAVLTYIFLERGKHRQGANRTTRRTITWAFTSIVLAAALALSGLATGAEYGNQSGSGGTGRGASGSQQEAVPGAVGGDYPGVVLWPEVRRVALLIDPRPYGIGSPGGARNPFRIPFGGEYWLYRPPVSRPPAGSYFHRGTPAAQTFHTTDKHPLAMEARHRLDQAMDARCCSEIRVDVLNAEPNSAAVSVELMLRDRERPGNGWQSLGQRALSSKAGPNGSAVKESIRFAVLPGLDFFDEFRVVFHRALDIADRSVRIAIDGFVLTPR